jgi:hypothetical protein
MMRRVITTVAVKNIGLAQLTWFLSWKMFEAYMIQLILNGDLAMWPLAKNGGAKYCFEKQIPNDWSCMCL